MKAKDPDISSSATDMISIRYTGRQSDDALNVMTSVEQLIAQSTAPNPIVEASTSKRKGLVISG